VAGADQAFKNKKINEIGALGEAKTIIYKFEFSKQQLEEPNSSVH
jgi:hypothetical protein